MDLRDCIITCEYLLQILGILVYYTYNKTRTYTLSNHSEQLFKTRTWLVYPLVNNFFKYLKSGEYKIKMSGEIKDPIYTSDLHGNDESGDGSEGKPFKTILQAMRHAGSEPFPIIYVDGKENIKYEPAAKSQLKKFRRYGLETTINKLINQRRRKKMLRKEQKI